MDQPSSQGELPPPQAVYIVQVQLPCPGANGSPHFDGDNVSEFLEDWDAISQDYELTPKQRRGLMLRYCTFQVRQEIKAMPEWSATEFDWALFAQALKRKYRWWDFRQELPMVLVDRLCNHELWTRRHLELWCGEYDRLTQVLYEKKLMSEVERGIRFLLGLPVRECLERVVESLGIDLDNPETIKYREIYSEALKFCTEGRITGTV
jgi:hypothetical protein